MHWGIYNDSQLHAILGTSLDLSLSLSTWSYPLVFVIMGQIVGNSAMNDKTWSWKSKYFTSCLPSLLCLFSGYTLACQYCWTIWINLRWIGISRLVNGPISIQLFQEDGIIFWNENRKQSFANENVTLRVINVFVQSSQHVQCNSIV